MITSSKRIAAAVGLCVALSATAQAEDRNFTGVLCTPNTPTDAAKVAYTQWGVQNDAASAANVQCGGSLVHATNVTAMGARVYDRSSSADVCCVFLVQNIDGVVLSSATRCSAGTSSGTQNLSFVPPANTAGMGMLQCSIPAVSGGQLSHVTSYWLTT